jgi:hypothetical protein
MQDEDIFEYLIQMGMMRPEELEMKRKQAMVDALREQGTTSPQGQMVGKHYVAPSITQYAAQMANAYGAGQGQKQVDGQMRDMTHRQAVDLDEIRRRRGLRGMGVSPSYGFSRSMDYGDYGGA